MKNKLTTLTVMLTLLALSTAVFAQPEDRDLGVFADPGGASSRITAPAFVPTFMYVLGWNLDGQVKGFEFEVVIGDPSLLVLARTFGGPWLNVGSGDNFIVGTGGCLAGDGVWFQFVQYQVGFFVPVPPNDVTVCLQNSTPSSFSPPLPGYLQCDSTLVPFGAAQNGGGVYPDGCGVLNATWPGPEPISTTAESFGALKTRF